MDFDEFSAQLLMMVQEKLGEQYECTFDMLTEMNGKCRPVLWIVDQQKKNSAAPSIYLDDLYSGFINGFSMDECLELVIRFWKQYKDRGHALKMLETVTLWERAKEHIYPVLIPIKLNEHALEQLVYQEFYDMAIIFEVWLQIPELKLNSSVKVTVSMLADWGINERTLRDTAFENLKNSSYYLQNIKMSLLSMVLEVKTDSLEPNDVTAGEAYELSYQNRARGASMILNEDLLYLISQGRGMYLLVPSVHEMVLMIDDGKLTREWLIKMAREVYQLAEEGQIQLSRSIFYYNPKDRKVMLMEFED